MSEKTHRLKCMAREIMENKINYTVCVFTTEALTKFVGKLVQRYKFP